MSIMVNGIPITGVCSLKYLGARFNSEALCEEIKTSLTLGKEHIGKLNPYGEVQLLALKSTKTETVTHGGKT